MTIAKILIIFMTLLTTVIPLFADEIRDLGKQKDVNYFEPNRVNAKDSNGFTPLYSATWQGHTEMVGFLISKGADVNAKTNDGFTALHVAASKGYKEVVDLLIAKGADINAKNEFAGTALHYAASSGYKEVAELLINKGADINAKTDDGDTPLHLAAFEGHKEIVKLLAAKGANINTKDNRGSTPFLVAVQSGHMDIAELLRKHVGVEHNIFLVVALTLIIVVFFAVYLNHMRTSSEAFSAEKQNESLTELYVQLSQNTADEKLQTKEPWLAGSLSWLLPGVGHFYVGKYIRGLVFLPFALFFLILFPWIVLSPHVVVTLPVIYALCTGLYIILIIATYDAVHCAKISNMPMAMDKTHQDPWFAVFLSLILNALGYIYLRRWITFVLVMLLTLVARIGLGHSSYGQVLVFLMGIAVPIHVYMISSKRKEKIMNKMCILFFILLAFSNFTDFLAGNAFYVAGTAPTGSMEPTLKGGDKTIENYTAYRWSTPKVGDIVIFRNPIDSNETLCKRIAAVGGETIQIKDGHIIVDGKERKFVPEKSIVSKPPYAQPYPLGEAQPYLVPNGYYFVLGDNVYNSFDSRVFGALPKDEIIAKIPKIIYPTNRARVFSDN